MGTLSVITCMTDGQSEAAIISQLGDAIPESKVIFRHCDPYFVKEFLANTPPLSGRIIIFHDHLGAAPSEFAAVNTEHQLLLIDTNTLHLEKIGEVARSISQVVRESETNAPTRLALRREPKLIMVTGSSGSPGITTIAANLAWQISLLDETYAIDQDPRRRDLLYLFHGRGQTYLRLSAKLTLGETLPEKVSDEFLIVDAGCAPELRVAKTDRRSPGRTFIELLERAGVIIYVSQTERSQIKEFERFFGELEEIRYPGLVIPILNKFALTKDHRLTLKELKGKSGGREVKTLGRDQESLDRAKSESLLVLQSSPRSKVSRALIEVANNLFQQLSDQSVRSTGVPSENKKRELRAHRR